MTNEQLEKINILNRLYYAETKLNAAYSVKNSDRKRAESFIEGFPEKDNSRGFEECQKEARNFYKFSAKIYLEALKEYRQIREKTEKIINSVNDDELSALLKYRYIDYLSWEKIAEKMFYSLRTVKYKHKAALDKTFI